MIQQPLNDAIVDATLILDCEGGILIIKRQNMSREAIIIIRTNQRTLELSEPTGCKKTLLQLFKHMAPFPGSEVQGRQIAFFGQQPASWIMTELQMVKSEDEKIADGEI